MAKESSFDIVSTVDMQEVDNAFQQAKKELSQRYDLKDLGRDPWTKAPALDGDRAPAEFVAPRSSTSSAASPSSAASTLPP